MLKPAHLALLLALVPALAVAETSQPSVVATRQAGFKAMGGAMKTLRDQLQSDAPDPALMTAAARTIAARAQEQGALFPAGSGPAPDVKTDALPAIWTDRTTFDTQMAALVTESGKLVTVATGGDVAAIRAQVAATGATCGACHKAFRADT